MSKTKTAMDQDGFYFVPLGGSEQFGVNLNVYGCDGKFLAVDCGIGFADERFPGIDLLLPDASFLAARRKKLEALIITHAHEDHIGAVPYLWDRLQCPIYTCAFTAEVLRHKFKEANIKTAEIHIVEPMETIKLPSFEVQFIPVAHSIPDACGLVIGTGYGNILHSGDWNLDPKPVVGNKTDAKVFQEIGKKKKIMAYIGDSTNAEVRGRAGSESEVEIGLYEEFKKCHGKIAVTVFSSNISRIISITRAAAKCGRDVGVIGRSLHRMIGCARECGYLDDLPDFIPEGDLGYLPDERTVMICTGSQGEYRAALAKIARGDHPSVTFKRGDSVIFSARAIPGNERAINAVKNNLSAGGINIITPRDTKNVIHVSGHPCRDEIADMLQWVRPKAVIPVHGERAQLEAQADFARECQVPQAVVPSNGTIIKFNKDGPEAYDHIPTALYAVDLKRIIDVDHPSISQRRKLQYTGVVHISLVLNGKGRLMGQPKIDLIGLVDDRDKDDQEIVDNLQGEVLDLLEEMTKDELQDDHFVAEEIRIGVRRFFAHFLGMKPKTTVHMIRI